MNKPALLRLGAEIFQMPLFALENRLRYKTIRASHVGIALQLAYTDHKADDITIKQLLAIMYLDFGVESRLAKMFQLWLDARERQAKRAKKRNKS